MLDACRKIGSWGSRWVVRGREEREIKVGIKKSFYNLFLLLNFQSLCW